MAIRVYVVDDEDAIRRSLRLMLRLSGYDVAVFESGPAFLGEVDRLPAGCILLDVRMPEMDGLEVQRELLRRGVDAPVVIMTGHGDIAVAVSALQAGAVDFLEKPFERAKIVAAIERGWLSLADPDAFRDIREEAVRALDGLSGPERSALDLFAQGLSNQAVASALDMGLTGVETARASLIARLGGSTLSDAIRVALLARNRAGR